MPVTVEVSLIKKIVKSILDAKEGLQADILQRQSVLLYTLKDVLKEYLITLPSSGVLNERLEKLKAYVAEKEVPGLDLNEALRLIETMREQLEITSDTDDAIVFLSQKLESPEITQQAYLGDESVLATGLIQNHKELSLNRSFCNHKCREQVRMSQRLMIRLCRLDRMILDQLIYKWKKRILSANMELTTILAG